MVTLFDVICSLTFQLCMSLYGLRAWDQGKFWILEALRSYYKLFHCVADKIR